MAGAMLAAASHRVPILVDGFIATVSALIADMIAEGAFKLYVCWTSIC